jgi:hypothetical protein
MRQDHYVLIVKSIQAGMPAIANELIEALNQLVASHNEMVRKETEAKEAPQPGPGPAVAPKPPVMMPGKR